MQILLNGLKREIPDGSCVSDLIEQLELKPQHVAVELNLQLIPRSDHLGCELSSGDRLEIVTLVGGG